MEPIVPGSTTLLAIKFDEVHLPLLKKAVAVLAAVGKDAQLHFSDGHRVCLAVVKHSCKNPAALLFLPEAFEHFQCRISKSIDLNLIELKRIIDSAKDGESLTMYVGGNPRFKFRGSNRKINFYFKEDLADLKRDEEMEFKIADEHRSPNEFATKNYPVTVDMHSEVFIEAFNQLGLQEINREEEDHDVEICISLSHEQIKFSASDRSLTLIAQSGDYNVFFEEFEGYELLREEIHWTCDARSLMKASHLSETVLIHVSLENILLDFEIESVGKITISSFLTSRSNA